MGSLLVLGGISITIIIVRALVFRSRFTQSKYDETNGANWLQVMRDTGAAGEFYTYEKLENLPGHHHLITNLYLPKKRGGTTEVDLVFICESGIYVFESKNYSGWIFGNEKGRYWTQVLNKNHKERFFNPIMQNAGHIAALKDVLEFDDSYFRSIIVFSERCQLKKVEMESDDILVVKRDQLARLMKEECLHGDKRLSKSEVDAIFYRKLLPYSHADQEQKDAHINGMRQ